MTITEEKLVNKHKLSREMNKFSQNSKLQHKKMNNITEDLNNIRFG